MTEGTEQAIETMAAGVLFCMAITMLLLLHTATCRQTAYLGRWPEQLVLFEDTGDDGWKHLDE
ncbi:MAG: hypothetical protein IJW37_05970 [Lachnospiraceae bacterium]|nr:hypothetical protein [Lachnospiraceae bacterium]